jgi:hypothetical protein
VPEGRSPLSACISPVIGPHRALVIRAGLRCGLCRQGTDRSKLHNYAKPNSYEINRTKLFNVRQIKLLTNQYPLCILYRVV